MKSFTRMTVGCSIIALALIATAQTADAACCTGTCSLGRFVEFDVAAGQAVYLAYDVAPTRDDRRTNLKMSLLEFQPNVRDGYWKHLDHIGHFTTASAKEGKIRLKPGTYRVLINGSNFSYKVVMSAGNASDEEAAKTTLIAASGAV